MIRLEELNALPAAGFVAMLGGIFEHSPWVAERVADRRPFGSVVALTARMRAAVTAASPAEQLALIRAHPRLGARGPQLASLTSASQGEQRRAGLAACSDDEYAQLLLLNDAYMARFDFPFILAVRGHDPASIIASCRRRLGQSPEEEAQTALAQIGLIAGFRLADTVRSHPVAEVLAMREALQGPGVDPAPLFREWLLGAHFEVTTGSPASPSGRLPAATAGIAGTPAGATIRLESPAAAVIGIAVARALRDDSQAATHALVVDPLAGQAGPEPLPVAGVAEQVKYLHSQMTSSRMAADEHR